MNGTSRASGLVAVLAVFLLSAAPLAAHGQSHEGADDHPPDEVEPAGDHDHAAHPPHGSLGNVGAKLANPLSDLWSMQMNFQGPTFFDGDLVSGSPEVGGSLIAQPVMPLPMYGSGEDQWRLIVRPILPIIFSQPKLSSSGFTDKGGLGDLILQTFLAPPASFTGLPKGLILGVGPALGFPTSTTDAFGNQQFTAGPAVALGWKTKFFTTVAAPAYMWGYADRHDRQRSTPDASGMQLLYALTFNLPDAWQIGMNPTITYNDKAGRGDKWNVPIGLFGAKTIKIGRTPVNVRAGLEYSVVSEDSFGKRANFRIQITPVIPSLIQKSIFGGN